MKRIELTITALSPLALGRQKPGGSVIETENYIPGSVLRGAIAIKILQQSGQESANLAGDGGDFQALFLGENPAIFQNAYPAIAKMGDESRFVTNEIKVLPATAVSSKTDPGFTPKGHGVFDTLLDRFCAEAYNQPYDPSDPKALEEATDARVEPKSGFYSQDNGKHLSHNVSTRFLTRVGINRRRATAEEQILYSIEVLNESFLRDPKAKFPKWEYFAYCSLVIVPDDSLAEALQRFINANSQTFRISGSASRGLGKVKIEAKDGKAPVSIASRLEKFNQTLKDRWQLWSVFGKPKENLLEGRTYFTLDLQSEAILTENWQRTTVISEEMLRQFAGVEDSSLKLHVAYSSYDYRSGWNAAWGLMKDMELVTNKGAVYLFSTKQPEPWFEALKELELKGVGDRTCEGFGQVQICNEFHLVFREQAV